MRKGYLATLVWLIVMLIAILKIVNHPELAIATGTALDSHHAFATSLGITSRVSTSSSGEEGNGWSESPDISSDGCYITFESEANNLVPNDFNNKKDIFIHDRQTNMTMGIIGNDSSGQPVISADGRYIAFYSSATNLVPNDTNDRRDIFMYDQAVGTGEWK
jgi:Tol biopolymer transport system component